MLLTASVTKDELASLICAITPLRLVVDERRGRIVTLGRPHSVELVPGEGLRVRGDAHVAWDVAGVAVPVTIQAWQILLAPRIATRGKVRLLALVPTLEELDLKLVPAFLDGKIAEVVQDSIARNRERLAWDFARALSKRLPFPARMAPARFFELVPVEGSVAVTATEIGVAFRFEGRIEKAERRASREARQMVPRTPQVSVPVET